MDVTDLRKFSEQLPTGNMMPAWFIGHGNPMNALADNDFTHALARMGKSLQQPPAAILVISAHWLTRKGTFVAMTDKPETIYDFYGFPEEMYKLKYPAPGAPAYAEELKNVVTATQIHDDHSWGLDHGAWTVLLHLFPEATIPVFQMSIDYSQPGEYHFKLAQELAVLRQRGVLIIGSGNIVHNLRQADFYNAQAPAYDWALEFDAVSKSKINSRAFNDLIQYEKLGQAALLAVPTPDHYWPMIYSLGLATSQDTIQFTYEEIQNASVSMRCFEIRKG